MGKTPSDKMLVATLYEQMNALRLIRKQVMRESALLASAD